MSEKKLEGIIQNLADAGCGQETVADFLHCMEQGNKKKELCVLKKHRKELLDCLHENQKKIDCLDYLIYHIEKMDEEK
ncbi:MAG: hypothetical protein EOM40_10900 [Clostridia bacterium]|nr:hypothetical protein [Clostridia bacterium]NCC43271.1 hypothetical protein [Clostridia bacterium]